MNISSVSSSTGVSYSSVSSSDDTAQLEKQKANLEKELQKENQSKDDAKTKEAKVKQLQMQIQQIDAQIQQNTSGKTGQSQNAGQQSTPPKTVKPASGADVSNNPSNASELLKKSTADNKIDVKI